MAPETAGGEALPCAIPGDEGLFPTARGDWWWAQPLAVFLGLAAAIAYMTWAAFQGTNYHFAGGGANYLSPLYSPELFGEIRPSFWPGEFMGLMVPWSPAFLILWAPAGFRLTCYYYRGAYYKSFWADPPACAVGEPRSSYWGENAMPLLLQNLHRYMLYLAMGFIIILSYDAWQAMWFTVDAAGVPYGDGNAHFGLGVGSLVLALNAFLLGGYTLGCHSLRHLVGGYADRISLRSKPQQKALDCVSCLNRDHMKWAWFSLAWVCFTDLYVRLCVMGLNDWRFF